MGFARRLLAAWVRYQLEIWPTETESVASGTSWSLKWRRHHCRVALIFVVAALPSGVELLYSISIVLRRLEVLLSMRSWSYRTVLRSDEALTAWDVAEYFVHGFEGCRLCSCCHLLALQAIIEFLCLLMFAALLSERCHEILIFNFEPVLVYLHVCL